MEILYNYHKEKTAIIFTVTSKKVSKAVVPISVVMRELPFGSFSHPSWLTKDEYVEKEKEAIAYNRKYNTYTRVYAYGAIYILTDENETEYYVPLNVSKYVDYTDIETQEVIDQDKYGYGGGLIGISSFLVVRGYTNLKQKFENQRVQDDYEREVLICKKIALKDGVVVAAMTDTLSTSVSYFPVIDIYKGSIGGRARSNKIICAKMLKPWASDPNRTEKVEYHTIHDMDSIKNKNAYEDHLEEIEKAKKDEKRKQELIKKYGQKYGTCILNKQACVGMTKAMCKEAIGTPDQVTKSQTSYGTVEVWTYSLAYQMWHGLAPITVVTFTNDKVTSVDEYTSWPF